MDQYLIDLDKDIHALRLRLNDTTKRLENIVEHDDTLERERGLDEARLRLAGQVELFLASTNVDDLSVQAAALDHLKVVVAKLERDANGSDVAERMNDDALIVASAMKDIIAELPFAPPYKDAIPVIDWRNFQLHLLVNGRRKVVMPAIGSDENYLAIHLALTSPIQTIKRS